MKRLEALEKEIDSIKKRNEKVTEDKVWETSKTRKALLTVFTYISIGLYLQVINVSHPWLNAIVPSIGFLLSTLTLPYFKGIWSSRIYNK